MRILSTAIEELSHRSSNIAAASHMRIQEMLRTLSIEEKFGHIFVSGSLNHAGHISEFELEISPYGEIFEHFCSCPFHEEEDACGHIIALCEYLALREFKLPYHLDVVSEQRRRMKEYQAQIRKLEQRRRQRESHTWLQEEAMRCLSVERSDMEDGSVSLFLDLSASALGTKELCRISLRIRRGQERLYVIRDLPRFFDLVRRGEPHSYGKGLCFVHRMSAFDEESQALIVLLQQLHAQTEERASARSLVVEGEAVDRLAACIRQLPTGYCSCRWKEEPLRLHLQMKTEEELTNVSLLYASGADGHVITRRLSALDGLYEIDEEAGVFYSYTADPHQQVIRLYHQLLAQGELLLDAADLSRFYHAYLRPFGAFIEWKGELAMEQLTQVEDAIALYLDISEDAMWLVARLEYVYDGEHVSAFAAGERGESLKAQAVRSYFSQLVDHMDEQHTAYLKNDVHWSAQVEELTRVLGEHCQIFASEQVRAIRRPRQLLLSVGVRLENDLLDLQLDLGDIDAGELSDILKSYRRKKKYHRLRNGDLLSLESEELKEASELFEQLQLPQDALTETSLTLPAYRLYNLETLSEAQTHIRYDQEAIIQQQAQLMKQETSFALPDEFVTCLRDYQKEGFQWLKTLSAYGFGGLLADDMGLGKTVQVLAYLRSEQAQGKQSLVVCPASLLLNWQDEAGRFAPQLNCAPIYGSKPERKKRLEDAQDADLLVTSYDYLKRDQGLYAERFFDTVILDEAQYISNPRTKNAQTVKQLRCRQRFALSGTPIENTLTELWSIYDFLLPGYLYTYSYFSATFERPIVKEQDAKMTARLQRLVRPFLLRRTKQEVLSELPDKEEHILYFELEKKEKELYLANAANVRAKIEQQQTPTQDTIAILALITRLRQLCQDARLVYEDIDWISSKLRGCMELIRSCIRAQKKVLLFSSFTSMLDLLAQELEKEGIRYYLLTGATAKEKRHADVERFQKDDTPLFMISLKAGGTGLNLTAAEVVIHFDPWWNLSAQNQATDRAHRIGQHNNVQVYQLIMKGTIEERIRHLQEKKKDLADLFVRTQNENLLRSMSKEELLSLFQ